MTIEPIAQATFEISNWTGRQKCSIENNHGKKAIMAGSIRHGVRAAEMQELGPEDRQSGPGDPA